MEEPRLVKELIDELRNLNDAFVSTSGTSTQEKEELLATIKELTGLKAALEERLAQIGHGEGKVRHSRIGGGKPERKSGLGDRGKEYFGLRAIFTLFDTRN